LELSWKNGGRRELAGSDGVISTGGFGIIADILDCGMLADVPSSKRIV
jgi:hypothetical protein